MTCIVSGSVVYPPKIDPQEKLINAAQFKNSHYPECTQELAELELK